MDNVTCFVGLDYHQKAVQVCVLDAGGKQRLNRSCPNDWRKIVDAVAPLGKVQRVAVEACGGSADLAQELVEQAGWRVELAHPGYVERMKRSPDKTDYSDSRMLADLTRVGYLPKVWLASAYERDLRMLVNHRQSQVDQRRNARLRLGAALREQRAFPPEGLSRWSKGWIAWVKEGAELSGPARWMVMELLDEIAHLEKKIQRSEGQLGELTAGDGQVTTLMKEPGIGPVTAWVMRAFVGRLDRFTGGKQLSRYCGLSPRNASSGERQADAGLVRGCNKLLRATLIQAAHRLIRTQERWQEMAMQMKSRGKPACVTVAAVANRWVRGLWHRLKEA